MDENFAEAIRATGMQDVAAWNLLLTPWSTGKKNLIVAGVTTDVCLVPPALSMQSEGFHIKVGLAILGFSHPRNLPSNSVSSMLEVARQTWQRRSPGSV